MYVPKVDEVFKWDGETLICKREPMKMWPCQRCVFADNCTAEDYKCTLPPCRGRDRDDGMNVVYQAYIGVRRRRPRER